VVGSSRNSRLGLLISSQPMARRFFSPPDRPRTFSSPTRVSRDCKHRQHKNATAPLALKHYASMHSMCLPLQRARQMLAQLIIVSSLMWALLPSIPDFDVAFLVLRFTFARPSTEMRLST